MIPALQGLAHGGPLRSAMQAQPGLAIDLLLCTVLAVAVVGLLVLAL